MIRSALLLILAVSVAGAGVVYKTPVDVEPAVYMGVDGSDVLVGFNLQALVETGVFVDGFGAASEFRISGAGFVGIDGSPDLPAYRCMVLVGNTGDYRLEVVSEETSVLGLFDIAARQPSPTRDGTTFPYRQNPEVYGNSAFFPGEAVTLESISILRDLRVAWVRFNPVRYNPVTGETIITTEASVRLVATGSPGENELVRAVSGITPEFLPFYEEVLGFDPTGMNTIDGSYLVIGTEASIALCQDLIDWKAEKGYDIQYGIVPTIGNTSGAIDAWIENAFNTWPNPPLYLLICGSNTSVPAPMSGSTAHDNLYGVIGTSTSVPSIHLGRICNQDTDDLAYQTWKIRTYESDPYMPAVSWFQNAISIGSTDFQDPAHSWEYAQIFMASGMSVDYFCSQGGMSPTISGISASVNAGAALISYIGHGDVQYWVTSGFSNTDVAALTNGKMLPWINSIACYNCAYIDNYCFGEAWMNEGSVTAPKGAVGFMGATTSSPVGQTDSLAEYTFRGYFEDEIWHMGAAVDYGKLKVEQFYGFGGAQSNNNMHLVFGCPETDIFCTTSPLPALTASHSEYIHAPGSFTVTVTSAGSPLQGVLVGAAQDGTYLDGAYTDASGVATLTVPTPPSPVNPVTITATYHNRVPYRGSANPITGIEGGDTGSIEPFWMGSPAPNPFSSSTSIPFGLSEAGPVRIEIFDMAGRIVRTLFSGDSTGGSHSVSWNGDDGDGVPLAGGIYLIRIQSGGVSATRPCVLLR